MPIQMAYTALLAVSAGVKYALPVALLMAVLSFRKAGISYSSTEGKSALILGKKRGVMVLEQTAPLTA